MTIHHHNPWESSPDHTSLVFLPKQNYCLSTSVSGPQRSYNSLNDTPTLSPLLIFFTGGGTPTALYIKARAGLSKVIRTLFYDRAGYDHSGMPAGDTPLTTQQNAIELDELLEVTGLKPPYILVGHSYGGFVQRQFLELLLTKHGEPTSVRDLVPGMVLFDTGTELMSATFGRMPPDDLVAVYKDVDFTGPEYRHHMGFSEVEWQTWLEAAGRTAKNIHNRIEDTHGSAWELAKLRQFDRSRFADGVLDVVRCNLARTFQDMYDAGVKLGGGTEEERKNARLFIEKLDLFMEQIVRAQLSLVGEKGTRRYRYLPEWPHEGIAMNPELVVECVEWVLDQIRRTEADRA